MSDPRDSIIEQLKNSMESTAWNRIDEDQIIVRSLTVCKSEKLEDTIIYRVNFQLSEATANKT